MDRRIMMDDEQTRALIQSTKVTILLSLLQEYSWVRILGSHQECNSSAFLRSPKAKTKRKGFGIERMVDEERGRQRNFATKSAGDDNLSDEELEALGVSFDYASIIYDEKNRRYVH